MHIGSLKTITFAECIPQNNLISVDYIPQIEQIKEKPYIKNILIVGAGYVIGLQKALNVIYPDLPVKLMSE